MRKLFESRVAAVSVGAAVIVGLGSTGAWAAASIGSDDIRNGGVSTADIRDGGVQKSDVHGDAVGSHEVKDGTLSVSDLRPGAVDNLRGSDGRNGKNGAPGNDGEDGVSGYTVFTSVQDFGPGGIGGAWCGAPEANVEDEGWRVIGGGAMFTPEDVNAGVAVVSSWPNHDDPLNPGWNIQVNKPTNVNPGDVTLYAVCIKTHD